MAFILDRLDMISANASSDLSTTLVFLVVLREVSVASSVVVSAASLRMARAAFVAALLAGLVDPACCGSSEDGMVIEASGECHDAFPERDRREQSRKLDSPRSPAVFIFFLFEAVRL